jgi:hypothetical protein
MAPGLTPIASAGSNQPMPHLGKWLCVVLAIPAIGLHWLLFQSVAVVTMTVRFTQDAPLAVAIAKTFSGQNPCSLCKFVKEGQAAESKQSILVKEARLDLLLDTSRILILPPILAAELAAPTPTPLARSLAPPLPPPRRA